MEFGLKEVITLISIPIMSLIMFQIVKHFSFEYWRLGTTMLIITPLIPLPIYLITEYIKIKKS